MLIQTDQPQISPYIMLPIIYTFSVNTNITIKTWHSCQVWQHVQEARPEWGFTSLTKQYIHLVADKGSAGYRHSKKHRVLLTWNDPVSILQCMEVVHELLYGDSKSLKQTRVLKESVGNLEHNNGNTSGVRMFTSASIVAVVTSLRYKPHKAANKHTCGHFQSTRLPFNHMIRVCISVTWLRMQPVSLWVFSTRLNMGKFQLLSWLIRGSSPGITRGSGARIALSC